MNDEWIEHLRDLTESRSEHADMWCTLGQALAHVGQPEEARDALDRALSINPKYLEAHVSRCFALGALKLAREGYAQFRRLSAYTFDDFAVVFALGVYCMRHGWLDTGVLQLRRARRLRPRSPYVALFLAAALEELGEVAAAEQETARALQLSERLRWTSGVPEATPNFSDLHFYRSWPEPGVARLYVKRAQYRVHTGDSEAAEEELRLANACLPGHPTVLVETARMHLLQDRVEEAERWLDTAVTVNESCHEAQLELGFLHVEAGRPERAKECLQEAVHLRPLFPDYRYHFGTLLLDLGHLQEAIDQFDQALVLNPHHGHSSLQLASAYSAQGRNAEARAALASGSCRDWPEALLLSAEILTKEGRSRDTRELLERVLAQDPDHPDAREALDRLDRRAG